MKICGGVEYSIIPPIFPLTTSCFTPRKRCPFPHTRSTEGWMSPSIDLTILRKGKSPAMPRMKL
jgi:hypothetical protein